MALKFSVALRNARLAPIEATIGPNAVLKIRTGAPPTLTSDADTGTVLATVNLDSDWLDAPSGGTVAKSDTWEDTSADGSGVAAHFRIYSAGGTVCFMQGTVTEPGGGGDMLVVNSDFNAGQPFIVTSFAITDGNQG